MGSRSGLPGHRCTFDSDEKGNPHGSYTMVWTPRVDSQGRDPLKVSQGQEVSWIS